MRVIITEKPSVAFQFASALKISDKGDGFIEGTSPVDNEEYKITWSIGHLVTMSYPERYDESLKKWSLSSLPFIPDTWLYEKISQVRKQFNVVDSIFKSMRPGDIYYNAGDSGREGEYIQRLIVQESSLSNKIEKRRIWIDSQTDAEILRGIKEAKPIEEYDALAESAYSRAKEDYLVGINFSRALSCAFGKEFNETIKSKSYIPISVGRVMTCVLGMIVSREREINAFKETCFYKIAADTEFKSFFKAVETSEYYNSPLLYSDQGFKNKEDAEEFRLRLLAKPSLFVEKLEKKPIEKAAPTLFNLAELQGECTKRFKISPDKTLEIVQSLYEKKYTTYPRTDARVISTAVAKEIKLNLSGLQDRYSDVVNEIVDSGLYKEIEKQKRFCDDSKITDHYAIIPTGEGNASLDELEEKIYDVICRRFLAIFMPKAIYEKTEVTLIWDMKERFFSSSEVLKDAGFLKVYKPYLEKKEDDTKFPASLQQGDILTAEFSIIEGKTKPLKRYTSGSMVLAMENAGKLIEDEELRSIIKGSGIGTSATRAETISKLIKCGYIALNNKTQILTPTNIGEKVYDIVDENLKDLLIPETTARWEQALADIAVGNQSSREYMRLIEKYVSENVEKIKLQAKPGTSFESKEVGKCPNCGRLLKTATFGIACTGRKDKLCGFALGYEIAGKSFSESELLEIANTIKETTKVYKGFKSKKNESFNAAFKLKDDNSGEVEFDFSNNEKLKSNLTCPKCMKNLTESPKLYSCDCGFKIFKTYFDGSKISEENIKKLLNGQDVVLKNIKSKSGKKYDAHIRLNSDYSGFEFIG